MANPSKVNPVFKSDAYTKRRPNVEYPLGYKSEEKLKNLFSDMQDKVYNANYDMFHLLDDFKDRANNQLLKSKFLEEKGLLPNLSEYAEKYKQKADIKDLINKHKDEYEKWVDNFDKMLPTYGIEAKPKLYKGYTASGNRRYVPATIENIVKEMKGGAGEEGWDYGVGNLRAIVTPKFKNISEIEKNRNRIIDTSNFNEVRDKMDKSYQDILEHMKAINDNYDAKDMLAEIAQSKNINAIDRVYKDVPVELKHKINSFMDELKQMPTEYFEIKPQKAVGIGEFKGAIVPKDIPVKAMTILQKNGIKDIYKYSSPDERKQLVKKFGKEFFAGIPLVSTAMYDNQKGNQ